ncbi:glycosyl hydrolase catalytic core-domain-containing protein [Russula aff. rugulosa BPL654]|nr:glycosyl hydrolase catalytic core-domain-containing protein [Russula aff. rugulosa BPL654]
MAVVKFLHILTVTSLAILHASFDARPVNALSVERGHLGRDFSHAHAEIAKKRDSSKKCRPRPSSAPQNTVAPTSTNANYAPSSTSSTSSSQPASTNAPSSSLDSKVMLPWSNLEQPSLPNFKTNSNRLVSDVYNIPNVVKAGYAKYCKFLNEPDITGEANTDPGYAVQLWNQYFQPLVPLGYKLIAPSVTGGGFIWLQTFLDSCTGCDIYALDLHYYGISVDDFEARVNQFHQLRSDLPMWLTEVGCHDYSGNNQPCTQDVFNVFFPGVMNFVENTEFLQQIGWFGLFKSTELPNGIEAVNAMITCPTGDNTQCEPNSLGYQYINYH